MKEVRIRINPKTCEVEYEVSGVSGQSCTDITDKLVEGDEVLEQKYTNDYYIPLPVPEFVGTGDDDDSEK